MRYCLFVGLLVAALGSRVEGRWPGRSSPRRGRRRDGRSRRLAASPDDPRSLGDGRSARRRGLPGAGPRARVGAGRFDPGTEGRQELEIRRRPRECPGAGVGGRDVLCGSRLRAFGPRRHGRRRPGRPPDASGHGPGTEEPHAPRGPDDLSAGGLRLGMDGRLYVAVGDRGIFHAVGTRTGGASSFRAEEWSACRPTGPSWKWSRRVRGTRAP